jgi:hypothetical protein
MGLLDEAIREHLDLKRRNGADPGDIARKENEALAPVVPAAEDQPVEPELAAEDAAYVPDPLEEALESAPIAAPVDQPDFEHVAQETAELDMQAELDGQAQPPPAEPDPAAAAAHPVRADSAPAAQEEDSLEWELPGPRDEGLVPEEIPGQERLSFE